MALNSLTTQQILYIINSKWSSKLCNLCGANAWAINGYLPLLMSDDAKTVSMGPGQVLPSAAVICRNCGNTHIINLVVTGLVPSE